MKKIFNKRLLTALLICLFFLSGCASIYLAPDGQYAADNHQNIAILPPKVIIPASKKVSADVLVEQQSSQSVVFQQEIYSYLLKRKTKNQMIIDVQDVESTNVLLLKNDVDISTMTTGEICELLDVDALLYSQFNLSKPVPVGWAIVMALFIGYGGVTNEIKGSFSLKDCESKNLIWKYDHRSAGGLLNSKTQIAGWLIDGAIKKIPYFIKN